MNARLSVDRRALPRVYRSVPEHLGWYHVLPGRGALCVEIGPGRSSGPPAILPRQLVELACREKCDALVFTGPAAAGFPELLADCFAWGREHELLNLMQVGQPVHRRLLSFLARDLDGAAVYVPTMLEGTARRLGTPAPHLLRDLLRALVERGVWVEVTTVLWPGHNDSRKELLETALCLAALRRSIPWHIALAGVRTPVPRLSPQDRESLRRAVCAGEEAGLPFVYAPAALSRDRELTFCTGCQDQLLIQRFAGQTRSYRRGDECCPVCLRCLPGLFGSETERPVPSPA